MSLWHVLLLLGGMVLLYVGAEGLVAGARNVALRMGLTPLVGGLVVVAFATSTPELAGSLAAQLWGKSSNMAVGNAIGSNVANIALIGGVSALIRPLEIKPQIIRREMPIMLVVMVLFIAIGLGDYIGRALGAVLLILMGVYLGVQIYWGLKEHSADHREEVTQLQTAGKAWWRDGLFVVAGIVGLGVGAIILVEGATGLARALHISDRVIGLTVVAIGTSLPELAASALAAVRNHGDIALGNIVGSSVFNLLLVVGAVAVVSPLSFSPQLIWVDAPVMLAFGVLLWALMAFGRRVSRLDGAILLVLYVAYLALINL